MALKGIDAVVFGVADIKDAKRFLDDWSVTATVAPDRLAYARWTAPKLSCGRGTLPTCRRRAAAAMPRGRGGAP